MGDTRLIRSIKTTLSEESFDSRVSREESIHQKNRFSFIYIQKSLNQAILSWCIAVFENYYHNIFNESEIYFTKSKPLSLW